MICDMLDVQESENVSDDTGMLLRLPCKGDIAVHPLLVTDISWKHYACRFWALEEIFPHGLPATHDNHLQRLRFGTDKTSDDKLGKVARGAPSLHYNSRIVSLFRVSENFCHVDVEVAGKRKSVANTGRLI
jgi:hypothetical protein